MKKILLAACVITACQTSVDEGTNTPAEPPEEKPETKPAPRPSLKDSTSASWKTYNNPDLGISLKYPSTWLVVENLDNPQMAVINLFPEGTADKTELPLRIHAEPGFSFVSIFPNGFGTELPSGKRLSFKEATETDWLPEMNQQESMLLQLENGQNWAYLLRPHTETTSWPAEAFIFAQIAVDDFRAECFDEETGKQKALMDCAPMVGDEFRRYGKLNNHSREAIRGILESLEFREGDSMEDPITDLIQVEQPLPNENIASPLSVRGKARGYWYSEGSFPLILVDKDGNELARTLVNAQGKWMTEDWVSFSAQLPFEAPDDERGYLIFERANPSGKDENARQYRLPVLFPPN